MKKGDKVLVYGTIVNCENSNDNYYLRGEPGKIIGICDEDEVHVIFKGQQGHRLRKGTVAVAHPMQCRKVKK